jgi:ATP-dependent helicase/DNAse subunit B
MPSFLIVSPAGSGKTTYLLQRIHAVKEANPLARVLVIVPNQLQVDAFQHRLAAAGGGLGVEVLTFYNLYAELLARAGQPMAALLDPIQIRLLRAIVDNLCERGRMPYYSVLRTRPGFILALRDVIQELKRARVFPDAFSAAVQGMGQRMEELAAVYTAYQDWLQAHRWADLEGRGWLADIALEEDITLGTDLQLLVITGFDEYNPTQLGVLFLLAERAGETLISLTGDLARPTRLAHRRFQRAQQALEGMHNPAKRIQAIEMPSARSFLTPELAYLEANLFETSYASAPTALDANVMPSVEFLEAQTRASEVRAALRWVKARLVRDGMDYGEVAVIAHQLDIYRPFLEEVAAEFGIPLRIIGGRPLAQNPAVAALLSLLSLPATNWPRRQLIEAWRSPYFDWAALNVSDEWFVSAADAATLDAISRQARVVAGQSQWFEAFDLWACQKQPQDTDEEGLYFSPVMKESGLREKFDAFLALLTPPATAPIRTYVSFVEDLIGSDPALRSGDHSPTSIKDETGLRIIAQARNNPATAERDVAALRAFKDVLRGLVLAEAALQSQPLDYAAFHDELTGAVEAATYTDATRAGVLVTESINVRGLSFRAAALLGLAEGEFPRSEREDPFLSEAERQTLRARGIALESRLRGDQAAIFYQVVTRPRQKLLLTRPYLAEDGQIWEESPYWKHVHQLMGMPPIQHIRPEDVIPPAQAGSAVELLSDGLGPRSPLYDHISRGHVVLHARLARPAASEYEGELPDLSVKLSDRYPESFGWSASKLEAYGTCPFYFYIAYTLGLEPLTPPEEGFDVRVLGSMFHKILENTYALVLDASNLEECLACMKTIAREVFTTAPADYGFRPTSLWTQQQEELIHTLGQTIQALSEKSEGFTPSYFEQKFGMGNPPLVLIDASDPGMQRRIHLHGYIDRIDIDNKGRLRVIDYKASGAVISPKHLQDGRRLQLPLYALAAQQALGLGEISSGFYWHIQKAEPSSLKLEDFPGGVESACESAVQHVIRHVANIRTGRFRPQPPSDGCPSYCPAVGFCWRYQSKGY